MKHFEDISKRVMRNYIKPLVKKHMTILSLPYLNFEIESRAKYAICVEREQRIYEQQQKIAPKNCSLNLGLASDYVGLTDYDLIYLDLCGSYSKEAVNCIENAKLADDGIIIMTALKGREHPVYKKLFRKGRIEVYSDLFSENGYYIYKIIEYNSNSAMIVFFASKNYTEEIETFKIE